MWRLARIGMIVGAACATASTTVKPGKPGGPTGALLISSGTGIRNEPYTRSLVAVPGGAVEPIDLSRLRMIDEIAYTLDESAGVVLRSQVVRRDVPQGQEPPPPPPAPDPPPPPLPVPPFPIPPRIYPATFALTRHDGAWRLTPANPRIRRLSPNGLTAFGDCEGKTACFWSVEATGPGREVMMKETGGELAGWRADGVALFVESQVGGGPERSGPNRYDNTHWEVVSAVDPVTGEGTRVAALATDAGIHLSPDGSSITWAERDRGKQQLVIAVARSTDVASARRYPIPYGEQQTCAFAQRDRRLVCVLGIAGSSAIAISIDLATGAVLTLTNKAALNTPLISPDGEYAAVSINEDETARIALTPVDRAELRLLQRPGIENQVALVWLR